MARKSVLSIYSNEKQILNLPQKRENSVLWKTSIKSAARYTCTTLQEVKFSTQIGRDTAPQSSCGIWKAPINTEIEQTNSLAANITRCLCLSESGNQQFGFQRAVFRNKLPCASKTEHRSFFPNGNALPESFKLNLGTVLSWIFSRLRHGSKALNNNQTTAGQPETGSSSAGNASISKASFLGSRHLCNVWQRQSTVGISSSPAPIPDRSAVDFKGARAHRTANSTQMRRAFWFPAHI